MQYLDPKSAKTDHANYSWPKLLGTLILLLGGILILSKVISATLRHYNPTGSEGTVATLFASGAIVEILALGILVLLLRRQNMGLADLGLGRRTTWYAVVAGVLFALAYAGASVYGVPTIAHNAVTFSWLKLAAIGIAIIAGTVEEIICRGYVMTMVASLGGGQVLQVVVGAVSFAVTHQVFGLIPMLFTLALGTALGIIYLLGNRSLTPVIVAHVLIDVIIEPGLFLSHVGG